ncbi:transmembrane protein 62-like [Agrilus planipennis]|nr:transmembrane protein 62-like [Agrilus planipennis]
MGREQIYSQPFSLDGSRLSFQILPRIALMTSASMVFKISFVIFLGFVTLPLIVMRYMNRLVLAGKMSKPIIRRGCLQIWIRKLWILSTVDRLFYPLICYCIYLPVGPWSVGYLVEDHLGAIFAWGILVNGNFLPGSFTYAYGFVQLATFQFPLILILANGVDNRLRNLILRPGKTKTIWDLIGLHLPFVMLLSIQLLMAYFFLLAYGYLAFFLGPLRTWSIVLALVLWCQTLQLPEKCTRDAANVWFTTAESELSQTSLNDYTEPAS